MTEHGQAAPDRESSVHQAREPHSVEVDGAGIDGAIVSLVAAETRRTAVFRWGAHGEGRARLRSARLDSRTRRPASVFGALT